MSTKLPDPYRASSKATIPLQLAYWKPLCNFKSLETPAMQQATMMIPSRNTTNPGQFFSHEEYSNFGLKQQFRGQQIQTNRKGAINKSIAGPINAGAT